MSGGGKEVEYARHYTRKKPGFICSAAQMTTCSVSYFVSAKEML